MKRKIIFAALGISLAAALFSSMIAAAACRSEAAAQVGRSLTGYMNIFEEQLAGAESEGSLQALAEDFAAETGVRVTLLSADGIAVADSGGEAGEDFSGREEVAAAVETGEGRAEGPEGGDTVRLCRKTGQNALVLLAADAPSFGDAWGGVFPAFAGAMALILLCGLAVAWMTASFALKPVEKLTREVATGAGREIHTDAPPLQPLVKMLNEMNADLESKVAKMKEDRSIEKLILNSMEHGIVIFRSASDVILINRTAERLLDYEKNEPIRCFSEDREIAAILEEGEAASVSRRIEGRDYSFRFTFKKQGSVLLITDVTETMAAARSKNDFIANVTHEMNTPLTSIRGFAELIAADGVPPERIGHAARTIIRQSDRLSALIRRIINFSAIDSDALPDYEVDLSVLLAEVLPSFEPRIAEKKIAFTQEVEEGVKVMSRRERLIEIVNNLVSNGIRYNKEGGSLSVRLTGGAHPVLCVRDTGVGIAEEDKTRIFDRFYTVDKSHGGEGGGFGLGLAIVKKLCLRAGWKLSVESTLGEGTEFKIEFAPEK